MDRRSCCLRRAMKEDCEIQQLVLVSQKWQHRDPFHPSFVAQALGLRKFEWQLASPGGHLLRRTSASPLTRQIRARRQLQSGGLIDQTASHIKDVKSENANADADDCLAAQLAGISRKSWSGYAGNTDLEGNNDKISPPRMRDFTRVPLITHKPVVTVALAHSHPHPQTLLEVCLPRSVVIGVSNLVVVAVLPACPPCLSCT